MNIPKAGQEASDDRFCRQERFQIFIINYLFLFDVKKSMTSETTNFLNFDRLDGNGNRVLRRCGMRMWVSIRGNPKTAPCPSSDTLKD